MRRLYNVRQQFKVSKKKIEWIKIHRVLTQTLISSFGFTMGKLGGKRLKNVLGGQAMVAHAFYPSTREAEAGGSL